MTNKELIAKNKSNTCKSKNCDCCEPIRQLTRALEDAENEIVRLKVLIRFCAPYVLPRIEGFDAAFGEDRQAIEQIVGEG